MNVFVTGATGYIGSAVVTTLLKAGYQVTGLVRSREKAKDLEAAGMVSVVGNLKDSDSYRASAADHEVLVHTGLDDSAPAEVDRVAMDTLLDAARDSGARRQVVFTSGVWVLGDTGGRVVDEDAPLNPTAAVAWRPEHERLVLEAATDRIRTVLIRPGMVYGGSRGVLSDLFQQAGQGTIRVVGDGTNYWSMIYLQDLAALYRHVIEKPVNRQVFHATDPSTLTVGQMARAALQAAGGKGEIEYWPLAEARNELGLMADALAMSQQVSSTKTQQTLGWTPQLESFTANAEKLFAEWQKGQETA